MGKDDTRSSHKLRSSDILIKCGKIALVLRLVCTYPVALAWANERSAGGMLLLLAVLTLSLITLLGWERVAPFVIRHPLIVALDIVLGLIVFASAETPTAYIGYLGSTALIIGLFFPIIGQVLLTSLLSLGYVLLVLTNTERTSEFGSSPTVLVASVILFISLTYVGNTMQKLQRQVDSTVKQARSAAADAALGQERSRLARELHDSLVKSLEGISLQAKAMVITGRCVDEASQIRDTASAAILDSRQLLRGLREEAVPPLSDALRTMGKEIAALHGVAVELEVDDDLNLPLSIRYAAHKIAEEALTNAAEHSGADTVVCTATASEGGLALTIHDEGRGFSRRTARSAREQNHFGLDGMRERAEDVGGTLVVDSKEGRGTAVTLTIAAKEQEETA